MGPIEKIHKTGTHKTQKWSIKWGSQTLSTKMRLTNNINKNETHKKKKHKIDPQNETHRKDPQNWDSQNTKMIYRIRLTKSFTLMRLKKLFTKMTHKKYLQKWDSKNCDSKTYSTKIIHKNETLKKSTKMTHKKYPQKWHTKKYPQKWHTKDIHKNDSQ